MNKSLILLAAGAAAMTLSTAGTAQARMNGAATRAAADLASAVEYVEYRHRRFVNRAAAEAFANRVLSRMGVGVEDDGTILLPGIKTDHLGRTTITGAPRNRTLTSSHRLGVSRIGTGTGGRLTGSVPKINTGMKPKHPGQ
jgi:hypothetical protein